MNEPIHIARVTRRGIEAVGAFHTRLAGKFQIEAFKGHELPNGEVLEIAGTRRVVAHWFDNIITNGGLDRVGSGGGFLNYCHIGTGTNTETATDTALQSFERSQSSIQSTSYTAQGSAPYYGSKTRTYRFNPPGSNKNYAEVGISWTSTTGNLFSRARIKDGGGSPTTISVLADEYLDVTYQCRNYPDALTLEEYSVGGYAIDFLASEVTTANVWGLDIGDELDWGNPLDTQWRAYSSDAAIGAVTGVPTASAFDDINNGTEGSYSPGTYYKDMTYNAGLNDGPSSGNASIGGATFNTEYSKYQAIFDPVIPKTNTQTLAITLRYTWARATIP